VFAHHVEILGSSYLPECRQADCERDRRECDQEALSRDVLVTRPVCLTSETILVIKPPPLMHRAKRAIQVRRTSLARLEKQKGEYVVS